MKKQIIWATIAIALFAMPCLNASVSVLPEAAVTTIKDLKEISPVYYITGDTVRQIYNANGLYMNFPDYTLTYRYPVYSYNPLDLSMLESVFSVKEDSRDCPLLNEVLGGTFTETRLDSPNGTYQFHWIVANQFANEIDLIRFDPYWNDAPVVIARYPVKTITTYATAAQGPESSVVGKWIVNYDWNCTGSPRNDQMIINSDGTWAWGTGGTGKWTRTGDNIHIVSDGGPAVYDGTIQASTISGAISRIGVTEGPRTGCWSASKVSS